MKTNSVWILKNIKETERETTPSSDELRLKLKTTKTGEKSD